MRSIGRAFKERTLQRAATEGSKPGQLAILQKSDAAKSALIPALEPLLEILDRVLDPFLLENKLDVRLKISDEVVRG